MNLMMFLLAGYETTSVTMAILTHLLAQHPDEMHKLQAELEHLTIVNNYSQLRKFDESYSTY
jgi:cytochrome P450